MHKLTMFLAIVLVALSLTGMPIYTYAEEGGGDEVISDSCPSPDIQAIGNKVGSN